jgi:hypothetical protein
MRERACASCLTPFRGKSRSRFYAPDPRQIKITDTCRAHLNSKQKLIRRSSGLRSDGGDLREIRRSKSIRFISDPCVLRIDLIPTRSAEPLFSLRFSTAIDDRCCAQTRGRLAQNCVQIDVWRCSKSQVIRPTKPCSTRSSNPPLVVSNVFGSQRMCDATSGAANLRRLHGHVVLLSPPAVSCP